MCRSIAAPVCSASTVPGGPVDGGGPQACGPAGSCEHLATIAPDWKPGDASPIPADFPPSPPGAQLCGSDIGHIVHYLYPDALSEVIAYYRQQLEARGLTLVGPEPPPDNRVGCDEVYRIPRPGHRVPAQLYVFLYQGEFTIGGFDLP